MEVRPFGIESVILLPEAFTSGTKHFNDASRPDYSAITEQYGDLVERMAHLG
jgi:hypothetical protein